MSDLKSKQSGIRFRPIFEDPSRRILFFGVLFPASVILIEVVSRLCAKTVFDPIPTLWHVLAVSAVPGANLLLWSHLRGGITGRVPWLAFANGAAIAIAGFYALIFIPVMPIAVIGIMFYGLGLLPFAPLAAFICAILLRKKFLVRHMSAPHRPRLLAGLAAGSVLLLALDIPVAVTRLGLQWAVSDNAERRERGVALLRNFGDDDLLLRLCYDSNTHPSGPLSWLAGFAGEIGLTSPDRAIALLPTEAREVYYRVHGEPFNVKAPPFDGGQWSRFGDFAFDTDLGGTEVGGRLQGLSLLTSRIDGSISADDAVAYLEWVLEFRNAAAMPREVRLELALPPGGVVSRATLWVNGEEREAAYGGRAEVRAAYQQVVVVQRRDPLLVTTRGADRVLAQAFPVAPGGTIKFKIGMSAPLDLLDASSARLTLPAIVDRNFSFSADAAHSIWIESKTALAAGAAPLTASSVNNGVFRVSGSMNDQTLSRTRQAITAARNPAIGPRASRLEAGEIIRQEVVAAPVRRPSALMLVIDGSARLSPARAALTKALDAIPPGARVGLILAQEPALRLPIADWSSAQKQAALRMLDEAPFVGGQDNAPSLSDALLALEAEPQGLLLWVHGPQPVSFRGSAAHLEQAASRLTRYPDVVLYSVEPGPNRLLPDAPWAWSARALPQTGAVDADIGGFFARTWDQAARPAAQRSEAREAAATGLATGSEHIARLWARDRVMALMQENISANRVAATNLAARYRLVTPVSGAVVLETQRQYDENRLTPAGQATVPTIPEPHEWALLLIACLALIWLAWRQRLRYAAAA